ncbi:hypothetical protein ISN36_19825 (plasmid) [Xanthomonas translucens pv. undulosa]|uniref:hypothetical protein n=1 Tax=Xanthomonas campestris pv. translucens TaxID=343 RepID=UPI0019D6B639|nr:hypothetical protein [Xanthomonas translucens]QSQ54836.1 hypothetical protein ISN36_19825 [Xanthomonas translucens pv. undulosa]
MNDDSPQDQLISHGEMYGWRLEVWKPGFWLDTYDYRIRPAPRSGEPIDTDALCDGCGFQSVEDAKAAVSRKLLRDIGFADAAVDLRHWAPGQGANIPHFPSTKS